MRIIISPTKKMRVDTDSFDCRELPVFLNRTETLMNWIKGLSYKEQKKLWVCSDKIAQENVERFAEMDLRKNLTPAIIAYDGIQCFITCVFGELENGKVVQKGVYAKMARGDMVRYMAEIGASAPEQLKAYDRCCYHFDESRSTDTEYVFVRTEIPGRQRHL